MYLVLRFNFFFEARFGIVEVYSPTRTHQPQYSSLHSSSRKDAHDSNINAILLHLPHHRLPILHLNRSFAIRE